MCYDSVELPVVWHPEVADRTRVNKIHYTVEVSSNGSHLVYVDFVMSAWSGDVRSDEYGDVDNVSRCSTTENAVLLYCISKACEHNDVSRLASVDPTGYGISVLRC